MDGREVGANRAEDAPQAMMVDPPPGMRMVVDDAQMQENANNEGNNNDEDDSDDEFDLDDHLDGDTPLGETIHTLARTIASASKELKAAKKRHKRLALRASVTVDPQAFWNQNDRTPKFCYQYRIPSRALTDKDLILLALQHEKVPDCMRWERFDSEFPHRLRVDRDVFLARVHTNDFEVFHKDKVFEVPRAFRNDKDVVMAICAKNPLALQRATKRFRNDPDLVMAALRSKHPKAPLAIQYASKKLRSDKKIVRVALYHRHGISCVKHIGAKLQADKQLILQSIRRSCDDCNRQYEVLSELPKSVLSKSSIVEEAVKKNGSNLRFCEPHHRKCMEICLPACQQDGSAFQYVLESQAREWLLGEDEFRMILSNGGETMLKLVPQYHNDKSLVLLAVQNGLNDIRFCSHLDQWLSNDIPFCEKLLQANGTLFFNLPAELKLNDQLARTALFSDRIDHNGAQKILQYHPKLLKKKSVLQQMAMRGFSSILVKAGQRALDDETIMLAACTTNGGAFQVASSRLRNDPKIAMAALGISASKVVFSIPKAVFEQHPQVAVDAIETFEGDFQDVNNLFEHLPSSAFLHRNVLLAFLKRDWKRVPTLITWNLLEDGGYLNDTEVMLAIFNYEGQHIKNYSPERWRNESRVHRQIDALLRNRDFMKQAVKLDGRLLHESNDLRYDYDLLLEAVAQSPLTLQPYYHQWRFDLERMCDFATQVRTQLQPTQHFIQQFLRGIAIVEPHVPPALRCHLPTLDRGNGVKKLIAEFIGLVLGPKLVVLEAAEENLAMWGF